MSRILTSGPNMTPEDHFERGRLDPGLDLLREQEVMQLLQAVELLLQRLNSAERREASS